MTFTLAIVGRPNVGKSTLFNRLVGQRVALVDDSPGVTRDRREGEGKLGGLTFTVVDTAGLDDEMPEILERHIQAQTERAIELADVLLFLVDARMGLLPQDREIADKLRRIDKPVLLVANKAEGNAGFGGIGEAHALGLGEPIAMSAEHGEGLGDLHEALRPFAPTDDENDVEPEERAEDAGDDEVPDDYTRRPLRIAVVGRPNAGKSTLINRLVGTERLVTGPIAGTTRDSISVDWDWGGRVIKLFDTAGLRRRARIVEKLEKLSASDALRAIRFADVVVVLVDVGIPFEKQDLSIADLIEREGRAVVLAVNKWDTIETKQKTMAELKFEATNLLPQVKGAPLVFLSGLTGKGVDRLMPAIIEADRIWNTRLPTAALNRWLATALERHPPKAVSGRRVKIRYMTQVKARPPTFALFGNQLSELAEDYVRYLVNGLREAFDLPGTPIRILRRGGTNPYADD